MPQDNKIMVNVVSGKISSINISRVIFIILLQILLISCATTLSFDVEHPPLVDLRNAETITVIPFEWNSIRYAYLSQDVTEALIYGLRGGKLKFVDPSGLRNISSLDLYKHVDIFITGRIVNVSSSDHYQTMEDRRHNSGSLHHTHQGDGRNSNRGNDRGRDRNNDRSRYASVMVNTTTRVVTVDIEYTYIRAKNNSILGQYRKSASASELIEETRTGNNPDRRNFTGIPNSYRQDVWTDALAARAIKQFSGLMSREISPWISTEKRTLKSGRDPSVIEANKMIDRSYYGRAFELYSETYERTGNIYAGYNLAIMLQFDSKFSEALELLKELQSSIAASGKKTPAYITTEIGKLTGYLNGFLILEDYK